MDSKIHAENSQLLSESRRFNSFQLSSVYRRMETSSKDLDSTFPEVKSDPECRMSKLAEFFQVIQNGFQPLYHVLSHSELWMYLHKHQQVPCLECRNHFNICLHELVKMMEEMEESIIKEKNEILEESKRIIEQDKIIEGMQKKINKFLGVQNLKLVELNYLWLSRLLKFSVCYFIALLLFYKPFPVLAWLGLQLGDIYWHYLPCEYPF